MDNLANAILAASSDRQDWQRCKESLQNQLHALINASRPENQPISSEYSNLLLVIRQINNYQCAVAVSYLLAIQSEGEIPDQYVQQYIKQAIHHLHMITIDHIPFCQTEVVILCHKLVDMLCNMQLAATIIPLLISVSKLLPPNPNCLSAVHADVLQACISSQMYSTAVKFLDSQDILEIQPKKCILPSIDYLRYFYYGGICYIAMKRYEDALESFMEAILTPASAISSIVIQSFRKARLVSLILTGTALTLPSQVSSVVIRAFKASAAPYDDIVVMFLADDADNLLNAVERGRSQLAADKNYGLAKLVHQALLQQRITRLPLTFLSLSMQRIADTCRLASEAEAERAVVQMIEEGKLAASIDKQAGMVFFGSGTGSGEKLSNTEALHTLMASMKGTMELSERLRTLQNKVLTSRAFITKLAPRVGGVAEGMDDAAFEGDL